MTGRLVVAFVLLAQVGSCMFFAPDYLNKISPDELNHVMSQKDIFLVDVHIPEQAHIKGTDIVVAFNAIKENIGKFPDNKKTPIYLYCKGGPMGNSAARTLHELGYQTIYNLQGGAEAWIEAGYKTGGS